MSNVLVVAAHPDDLELGCAGAIQKHIKTGDNVRVYVLGTGVGSRDKNEEYSERLRMCAKALKLLGVKDYLQFEVAEDNQFDGVSLLKVTQAVESINKTFDADIIYTHSNNCLNIDHRLTAQAVLTAARPNAKVKEIYAFEVLSSTNWSSGQFGSFEPNYFITLTEDELKLKIDAFSCYSSEIQKSPLPRNESGIRTLAKYRGMQAGVEYAEGFQLIRCIK